MKRRGFITGSGASLVLPFIPLAGYAADVDVVIIGAGSAGLSAAKILANQGINFRLLEAKSRSGGRAFTDTSTFGVPFDVGCTFQHQAQLNPLVRYAKSNGFKIGPMPSDDHSKVWVGRREASGREYKAMNRQWDRFTAAFEKAAKGGRDISAREAVAKVRKSKWDEMVFQWIVDGTEPEDYSVVDWWNGAEGKDFLCPAGYGTLVQHFAKGIPVELETTVKSIDWSGPGVKVETSKGNITAKYCLVTVSNGVLANQLIRFTPKLPDARMALLENIYMGNYTTIGLKFKRKKVLPVRRNAFLNYWKKDGSDLTFLADVSGTGITRANAHGNLALELEKAGKKAAVDYALSEMKRMLGSRSIRGLAKSAISTWSTDPHVMGTWSIARPGFGSKRRELRDPVSDRLLFAGEAYHSNMYSTCHGAWLTGRSAGLNLARKVKKG